MDFRRSITRSFGGLFQEQVVVEGNEDSNNFAKFWGYYIWVSKLSQDKIWKVSSITSLPLTLCLNHLSYLLDVHKEEEKAIKNQMKNQK